jgi:GNAT superfamily N-acetyltransferase
MACGEVVGMMLGEREEGQGNDGKEMSPFLAPIMELVREVPSCWYISMLGVYRAWRGKGVGTLLLDVAERKATETGSSGLALIVEDLNSGTRRLYERRGFAVRASRPMAHLPQGGPKGQGWLLMVKD